MFLKQKEIFKRVQAFFKHGLVFAKIKIVLELFTIFFLIGLFNFGGGYSVLPFFKQEIVEKRKWLSEEDLLNYFVIGQCLPGVIAINASTLVGYQIQRTFGALAATLGMVLPAFLSIVFIAILFMNFIHVKIVQNILLGINISVLLMIFEAILEFAKKGIIDKVSLGIFIAAFFACFWFSPAVIIFVAGLLGFTIKRLRGEV